jgi:hypothetical protein
MANHQMKCMIAQLQPKETIPCQRRNGTQTASECRAKMIMVQREGSDQSKLLSIVSSDPHSHCARDRYPPVEELFRFTKLRTRIHENKVTPKLPAPRVQMSRENFRLLLARAIGKLSRSESVIGLILQAGELSCCLLANRRS